MQSYNRYHGWLESSEEFRENDKQIESILYTRWQFIFWGGNKNLGLCFHRIKPCQWCVKCCKNGIRNTWFKKQYKTQDQHGKKANDSIPGAYFTLLNVSSGRSFAFSVYQITPVLPSKIHLLDEWILHWSNSCIALYDDIGDDLITEEFFSLD